MDLNERIQSVMDDVRAAAERSPRPDRNAERESAIELRAEARAEREEADER